MWLNDAKKTEKHNIFGDIVSSVGEIMKKILQFFWKDFSSIRPFNGRLMSTDG